MDNKGKLPRFVVNQRADRRRVRRPEQAQENQDVRETTRLKSTTLGVSLSPWEMEALDLMLGMIPEVREAQVEKFRKKIADGTYRVSADAIADKIIAANSAEPAL